MDEAKASAEAAKQAADAAEKQTDLARSEFIASHRPRLLVREVYVDGGKIWFRLVNAGETKATLVESVVMTEIILTQGAVRSVLSSDKDQFGRMVLLGGEFRDLAYEPPADHAFIFKVGQRASALGPLHVTGTVVYVDDFGIKRRSAFRRRWHNGDRCFVRLTADEERDNEYND